jgi:excisionase family DNA binding protein
MQLSPSVKSARKFGIQSLHYWRAAVENELKQFSPEYITVGFIARGCGVSNTTVLRWIGKGELPAFRLPAGHYRVGWQDFAEFLANYGIPFPAGVPGSPPAPVVHKP